MAAAVTLSGFVYQVDLQTAGEFQVVADLPVKAFSIEGIVLTHRFGSAAPRRGNSQKPR
jgi:hypothetical protein